MSGFNKIGDKKFINYSNEEYEIMKCKWFNDEIGNLNEEDGIECPKCNNKGTIAFIDTDGYQAEKYCECMKQRRIVNRLNKCGISKVMLDHYSFSNYETDNEWNKKVKDIVLNYCDEIKEYNTYWLYLSGITGSGKTHLCVATFKKFIKSGRYTAEYMSWCEDITKLVSLSKSYDTEDYDSRLKILQECDLLYIDDFLKLSNMRYAENSLNIAFQILDYRYKNDKITIISSETNPESLAKIDSAIAGRINEKTDFGRFMLDLGNEEYKNYRSK